MEYKNEIRKITAAEFFPAVVHMKTENWRLVQICASCIEGGYEMSYSFCLRSDMVTLRLEVAVCEEFASSTQIYRCEFVQENVSEPLFGVQIKQQKPDFKDK